MNNNNETILTRLGYFLGEIDRKELSLFGEFSIDFGKIIGAGQYTAVIKVDYPFLPEEAKKLEDPVLIVTRDKYKKELYESLTGLDTVFYSLNEKYEEDKKEWIEWEDPIYPEEFDWFDYTSEFNINPTLYWIEAEGDLHWFFAERIEPKEVENSYIDILNKLLGKILPTYGSPAEFLDIENADIFEFWEEDISEDISSLKEDSSFIELTNAVKKGISIAAKKLEQLNYFNSLTLDIHMEQFALVKGELKLIDPFVI